MKGPTDLESSCTYCGRPIWYASYVVGGWAWRHIHSHLKKCGDRDSGFFDSSAEPTSGGGTHADA